jgi:hypothetical protein
LEDDGVLESESVDDDFTPSANNQNFDVNSLPWHQWGGQVWSFSGGSYVHPTALHPDGSGEYVVFIRLRRNGDRPQLDDTRTGLEAMMGDSELQLAGHPEIAREWMLTGIPDIGEAIVELSENKHGRIGSLFVIVNGAKHAHDAYCMAQTVFNRIAVASAIMLGIPLRYDGMQITRFKNGEAGPIATAVARVTAISYANRSAVLVMDCPRVLAPLYTSFSEGLRSNSPFYAFLCFFTLSEFIIGDLQGRLRRLALEYLIDYIDLRGTLSESDSKYVSSLLAGLSYDAILKSGREIRNTVAHLIFEIDKLYVRLFNVQGEDRVSLYRDALKIASRDLLAKVSENVVRFKAAGVTDEILWKVFDGTYFEPM